MRVNVTTAPTRYPVSLAEVRADLQLEHQEDDPQLDAALAAAVQEVEGFLGVSLITRTLTGYLDAWPTDRRGCTVRALELPRPPLLTVTSVTTYDDDDAASVMSASDYLVDTSGLVGRVVLRNSSSWPTAERAANGIKVVWTAGYGPDMTDVPEDIRLGLRLVVKARYDDPECDPFADGQPALSILRPRRIWTL